MNSGMHSPTPTQTCTFPVYWLFSALPISHTILGTNIGIIVEYVMKKKTYGNAYIDTFGQMQCKVWTSACVKTSVK